MSNNYFLFLSFNSIFFFQWEYGTSSLKTGDFSPTTILWFFSALGEENTWFFMRKLFLGFLLSFFINYVAISAFCLRGKSFNEDRNHYRCTRVDGCTEPATDRWDETWGEMRWQRPNFLRAESSCIIGGAATVTHGRTAGPESVPPQVHVRPWQQSVV